MMRTQCQRNKYLSKTVQKGEPSDRHAFLATKAPLLDTKNSVMYNLQKSVKKV